MSCATACGMHAAEAFCFSGSVVTAANEFVPVTLSGMSLLSFRPVERQDRTLDTRQHQLIVMFYSRLDYCAVATMTMLINDLTSLSFATVTVDM